MATVTFKIVKKGKQFKDSGNLSDWVPAYKEGQLIFVADRQKIYLDFENTRTCYGSGVSGSAGGGNMNYLGITTTDPTTAVEGVVVINGEDITPNLNDVVVYGTKEYIWRQGVDGNNNTVTKWFEVGDEDAPTWET